MKKISVSWIIVLLLGLSLRAVPAGSQPELVIPAGLVNVNSADACQMLQLYTLLSGKELVTSSHVNSVAAKITLQPEVALKKSEVLKLFEKALLDQAGIVITKLDEKRVSVTYNDALPVTVVTNGRPIPIPIGLDGKPIQPPLLRLPRPKPVQK